jgi:hypothetical protein
MYSDRGIVLMFSDTLTINAFEIYWPPAPAN